MSFDDALPKSSVPLLVSAFLAAGTTGGTSYAFGLYGEALKEELHLSQSQLDTISSASFCAGVLSWIPGLLVDRFGERASLIGGGILGAASLLSFWTIAREFVAVPRALLVPLLSTCSVFIFVACALVTGAVFKVIVAHTDPQHKGQAVGAAKGYVGLGSGAYAVLFEALSRKTDLDFLPMAAFFFLIAASLPAMFLVPSKEETMKTTYVDLTTSAHYQSLYLSLISLAVLVVGESLVSLLGIGDDDSSKDKDSSGPDYFMALLVPMVWFGPIAGLLLLPEGEESILPTDVQNDDEGETLLTDDAEPKELADPIVPDPAKFEPGPGQGPVIVNLMATDDALDDDDDAEYGMPSGAVLASLSRNGDYNLWQMLNTTPAWLLFWSCTVLVGSGTVVTNNLGEMVAALKFDATVVPAALSLFSVAQSGARVVTGALSSYATFRPSFLILAGLGGLLAHGLLAVATTEAPFIMGVLFSGWAFGMAWPLMVLIVGELFGTAHVGANYMFYDGLTSAVGTLVLSKFVAQRVYESHIDDASSTTCYGPECFQVTNIVVALLSATCIFTGWCMVRTKLVQEAYTKNNA